MRVIFGTDLGPRLHHEAYRDVVAKVRTLSVGRDMNVPDFGKYKRRRHQQ